MKAYTTTEVSELCQVSIRTVCKWTDNGNLKSFRIPDSQHRRIPHKSLVEFLVRENYPLGNLTVDFAIETLLVTKSDLLIKSFSGKFANDSSMKLFIAKNGFEVAMQVATRIPAFIILDFVTGDKLVADLLNRLLSHKGTQGIHVIGLVDDEQALNSNAGNFKEIFRKPFDVALLFERLKTVAGIFE